VPPNEAGWKPDRISNGWLNLVMYGDNDLDILYQGAGKTGSYRGEGFQIIALEQDKAGAIVVIAIHPDAALNHFLFEFDQNKNARRVIWGSVRGAGNSIEKSTLMVAECHGPGGGK
jgi:hypothetical protein